MLARDSKNLTQHRDFLEVRMCPGSSPAGEGKERGIGRGRNWVIGCPKASAPPMGIPRMKCPFIVVMWVWTFNLFFLWLLWPHQTVTGCCPKGGCDHGQVCSLLRGQLSVAQGMCPSFMKEALSRQSQPLLESLCLHFMPTFEKNNSHKVSYGLFQMIPDRFCKAVCEIRQGLEGESDSWCCMNMEARTGRSPMGRGEWEWVRNGVDPKGKDRQIVSSGD